MSKIRLYGSTSGYIEFEAPAVSSDSVVILPDGPVDLGAGFRYIGSRKYLSTGAFDKSDALGDGSGVVARALRVRLIAGGGGGSGSPTTGSGEVHVGASGSGASYVESVLVGEDIPATATVTVGAGGAGGASGGNGSNGSDTVFGTDIVKAFGGLGGFAQGTVFATSAYPGVAGRSEGIGDIVVVGYSSSLGLVVPGGFCIAGNGGASHLGGGAQGLERFGSDGRDGQTALGYGGGGSGAVANQNNGTARNGGDGGPGLAVLDVFI